MAANGISTLASKEDRKIAKISLAEAKRQLVGTVGFRVLNYYVGTVSPIEGRPWSTFAPIGSGLTIVDENNEAINLITEDGDEIITE